MTVDDGDRCRFRPPDIGATVIWEVTDYCNLECLHCCTDSSPTRPRDHDLDTARMIATARELTSNGVTELYFSGGEPFARKDLGDIIAAIDVGVEVYCNTNGYFVDAAIAAALAGTALRRMTVSIDGHNRTLHALVRGKPSSYDRAIAAVGHLLAAGVPVRVSHVVHPTNVDYVARFCEELAALGVTATVINTVFPAGRASRNPQLALTPERERQLLTELETLKAQYAEQGMHIDHSIGTPEPNTTEGCPAGRTVYFVAANGDVSTCSWLYKLDPARFRLGNLWNSTFSEVRANVESMMRPVRALATHCPLPAISS